MEGFGQKSAENLKNSIDKAKKNSLTRILTSLSIHHVGRKASSILSARIKHVFDLIEWEESDYTAIDGIGPGVAQNLMEFFSVEESIQTLKEMEQYRVALSQKESDRPLD